MITVTKAELKTLLSRLLDSYPSSNINVNRIVVPYHDVLSEFSEYIIRRAVGSAPSRHPKFFPNAGELYEMCRELDDERKHNERVVSEMQQMSDKARDAGASLTLDEVKQNIQAILNILSANSDMSSIVPPLPHSDTSTKSSYESDPTGIWAQSRAIYAGSKKSG